MTVAGAAGEALEAELNKSGPGSCKFVSCDISKEEDIKVKCHCPHCPLTSPDLLSHSEKSTCVPHLVIESLDLNELTCIWISAERKSEADHFLFLHILIPLTGDEWL